MTTKHICALLALTAVPALCFSASPTVKTGSVAITYDFKSICRGADCSAIGYTNFAVAHSFRLPSGTEASIVTDISITLTIGTTDIALKPGDDPAFENGATRATVRRKVNLEGSGVEGNADITANMSWSGGRFNVSVRGTAMKDLGGSMLHKTELADINVQLNTQIEKGATYVNKLLIVPVLYSVKNYYHVSITGDSEGTSIVKVKGTACNDD